MELNYHIIRQLKEEKLLLEGILANAEAEISNAPEGKVLLKMRGEKPEFYHRKSPQDKCGSYISVKERETAEKLVRKRYLEHVRGTLLDQLKVIDTFLEQYDPNALVKVYDSEGKFRQKFLTPIVLPDDLYAMEWLAYKYEPKAFSEDAPEHYSTNNVRVRSKSEAMIADALHTAKIPYRYECPLEINHMIIHPDFTILRMYDRKIIYWEHFGMMDDIDYRNDALRRIRDYEAAGIFPGDNLIITYETGRLPLNQRIIKQKIDHYLLP